MIDFDEELKKFHPSLEIEDVSEAIYNQDLTDMAAWNFPGKSIGVGCHCLCHLRVYYHLNKSFLCFLDLPVSSLKSLNSFFYQRRMYSPVSLTTTIIRHSDLVILLYHFS